MKTSINELNNLTETEKFYRVNERLEEMHASYCDWERVLQDKWALAMWGQKGGN
jgi:hypothetical protein